MSRADDIAAEDVAEAVCFVEAHDHLATEPVCDQSLRVGDAAVKAHAARNSYREVEGDTAGLDVPGWARWIVSQARRTDWACRECVDADVRGQDEMVTAGHRCVWHEATARLGSKAPRCDCHRRSVEDCWRHDHYWIDEPGYEARWDCVSHGHEARLTSREPVSE